MTLLDDATTEREIDSRGGLHAIAISHPHYYSAMVEWAHRFECPVLLHEADREWVMRADPALEFWSGETYDLGDGLTLIRCGGHFAGGTVLHRGRRPARAATSSRSSRTAAGSRSCTASRTSSRCRRRRSASIEAALEPFDYERIYGAWWGTVIPTDGKGIVRRSAQRYIDALNGKLP